MFEYKTIGATCHSRHNINGYWLFTQINEELNKHAAEGYEHYHTVFVPVGESVGEISGSPSVILHLRRIKKEGELNG